MLVLISCNYAEPEIFYFPKGYTGTVVVVFNQLNAEPKEYLGQARVYKFSDDGILFTQFSGPNNNSVLNQKFYYVDDKGQILNEIQDFIFLNKTDFTKGKIYKFNSFTATAINKYKKNDYLECMYFSIGRYDKKDSLIRNSHIEVDKLIEKLRAENDFPDSSSMHYYEHYSRDP